MRENVEFGLDIHELRRAGGEHRCGALARALAAGPRLLRPTSSARLDRFSGCAVLALLRDAVSRDGTTLIAAGDTFLTLPQAAPAASTEA